MRAFAGCATSWPCLATRYGHAAIRARRSAALAWHCAGAPARPGGRVDLDRHCCRLGDEARVRGSAAAGVGRIGLPDRPNSPLAARGASPPDRRPRCCPHTPPPAARRCSLSRVAAQFRLRPFGRGQSSSRLPQPHGGQGDHRGSRRQPAGRHGCNRLRLALASPIDHVQGPRPTPHSLSTAGTGRARRRHPKVTISGAQNTGLCANPARPRDNMFGRSRLSL